MTTSSSTSSSSDQSIDSKTIQADTKAAVELIEDIATEVDVSKEREEHLQQLEQYFMVAIDNREKGRTQIAIKQLLAILQQEPRLPEPHLELAHMYLILEKWDDAKLHIENCIEYLEKGGQWLDMPENEILSMAYAIKGEVYMSIADQDVVIFGDPEEYMALLATAKQSFIKARELDPHEDTDTTGREFNWEEDILSRLNMALSKSPGSEPQP